MSVHHIRNADIDGACLRIVWNDGFEAAFAAAWLLDNAPTARAASHSQRVRTAQALLAAGPLRHIDVSGDAVRLEYANESLEWTGQDLRALAMRPARAVDDLSLWADGRIVADRPAIAYDAYCETDDMLEAALGEVARFGLVRLAGAGTAIDEAERAVARFGFIRETNYGRLFEVRVVQDFDNLASTAGALEPHTDNPYRNPAPTLQILHCIRNAGDGGATTFVDGFALAAWLRTSHPDDFARLARHSVPFAFRSTAGAVYETRSPVLRLDPEGRLTGIRFNHRAMGALDLAPQDIARWYASYLQFASEAAAQQRRFPMRMEPGDIVIFDNERVLHGRDAFSDKAERLLTGCYADRDGLLATLARLRRETTRPLP